MEEEEDEEEEKEEVDDDNDDEENDEDGDDEHECFSSNEIAYWVYLNLNFTIPQQSSCVWNTVNNSTCQHNMFCQCATSIVSSVKFC
jgi:hypothetical protein